MPPQPQRRTARAHAAAQGRQTQLLSGGCTCLLQISKSRRSSRAAGRHRALRRQLGQERLLHKYTRPFAAPSRQKQSLRQRRLHLCPAQRKNFFSRWTAGPFQADGAVRTGLRRWCKWPGRSYLQCIWPLRWSLGYHRIGHGTRRVVGTSPQLTGGGRTRARGCSCHLRARYVPLPLPSPLRPPGTRPRAILATDEPSSPSAQKSGEMPFIAALLISAFGGVHRFSQVLSAVWDAD